MDNPQSQIEPELAENASIIEVLKTKIMNLTTRLRPVIQLPPPSEAKIKESCIPSNLAPLAATLRAHNGQLVDLIYSLEELDRTLVL